MTERSDIHAEFNRSPRVIVVEADSTELTMQDLVDTLKGVIEQSWNGIDEPALHSSAGKEELGGEQKVGITVTLQDAQVAFEARNIPISTGTATSADTGTLLTDTLADFVTDGVVLGDTIINFDDHSLATVVEIVSPTVLRHYQLTAGINNDWGIGDFYHVQHVAQCNITGGNLVALDDLEQELSPISPTAFTQIVKTASASATLQELTSIQHSSFNERVTIDAVNGTTGTDFPKGTSLEPINNLSDAKAIASTRGFSRLYIRGDFTFGATDNINNYEIRGDSVNTSTITLISGCLTQDTEFRNCSLTGVVGGYIDVRDCLVSNVSNFSGCICDAMLGGVIAFKSSGDYTINNVVNGDPSAGTPIMDLGNYGNIDLGIRNYAGGIEVRNLTGGDVRVSLSTGRIVLASSCTGGTITLRGIGSLQDSSGGSTIVKEAFLNQPLIADATWDETIGDHQVEGSVGKTLGDASTFDPTTDEVDIGEIKGVAVAGIDDFKADVSGLSLETTSQAVLTGVLRNLGLTQENQYIDQNVYTDGKLTSARIRIYSDPASVGTDSDVVAAYRTTATYTGDEMTTYKVVKE